MVAPKKSFFLFSIFFRRNAGVSFIQRATSVLFSALPFSSMPRRGGHGPRKKPRARMLAAVIALSTPQISCGFTGGRAWPLVPGVSARAGGRALGGGGAAPPHLQAGRTHTDQYDLSLDESEARLRLESLFAPTETWDGSGVVLDLSDRTFSRSTKRAVEREKRLVSRVSAAANCSSAPLATRRRRCFLAHFSTFSC